MDKKAACVTPLLMLIVSAIIFPCSASEVFAMTSIRPGKLASSTEWTKDGSPYVLTGNFEIPSGRVLIVRPGTIIKFGRTQTGTESLMRVYGMLKIEGDGNEPVRLTTVEDDSIGGDTMGDGDTFDSAKRYSWAIEYRSASSTRINNASITNCGGMFIERTGVEFQNVTMDACQSAMYVSAGDITIRDSRFARLANGGITIDSGDLNIASSTLSEVVVGHAISAYEAELAVSSTTITEIKSGSGINATKSVIDIETSEISAGLKGYGLDLNASQTTVSSSTISNFGMQGIYVKGGKIDARELTVKGNRAGGILLGNHSNLNSELVPSRIVSSSIYNNGDFGANNTSNSVVDVKNSWWGSPTGPRNDEKNPSGQGNAVIGAVDFIPWLEMDPASTTSQSSLPTVMFIPGLEASRLYADEDGSPRRLWEPGNGSMVKELYLSEAGESVKGDIYAKDVIDEVYGTVVLENVYKSLLNELSNWKEEKTIADYSLVPYDWRLTMNEILSYGNEKDGKIYYVGSNRATTTPYLHKELARLAAASSGGVTIIAHSNGGLVTKAFLKKLQDNNDPLLQRIDKVILVAVPQYGTPQAVGALLHGYDQGLGPFDLVMDPETAREFGKNMAGAYPLLPSTSYWGSDGQKVATMPIRFEAAGFPAIEAAITKYGGDINTKSELDEFMLGGEGRLDADRNDIESPSLLNPALLAYANALHASLDSWVPPSHVTVHQIAGWGEDTLASIVYRPKAKRCIRSSLLGCKEYEYGWTYKPELVIDGDGTVVTPSALAMSTSSENVKRWWVDLNRYDSLFKVQRKHKDILEINPLLNVINILVASTTTSLSERFIVNELPTPVSGSKLYFTLHSPLDLIVTDIEGNTLSSTTSEISNGRYWRFGEIQIASVLADSKPKVSLVGQEEGLFDLDVDEVRADGTIASTSFQSIPVSTNTRAEFSLLEGHIESMTPLVIDMDNDGTGDISIKPEIGKIVTVPNVPDETAPEAKFVFSTTTNSIEIIGSDEINSKPTITHGDSAVVIQDGEGNSLTVHRAIELKNNEIKLVITKLTYSTTTTYSTNINASARYHFVMNKKGKLVSYITNLSNVNENIKMIYDQAKNITKVWTLQKDTDDTVENDDDLIRKGAILKGRVNGQVVPMLITNNGQVVIKY